MRTTSVVIEEPAKTLTPAMRPTASTAGARLDQLVTQALVVTLAVIVLDELDCPAANEVAEFGRFEICFRAISPLKELAMTRLHVIRRVLAVLCGVVLVGCASVARVHAQPPQAQGRNTVPTDLPGLSAEVAKVEAILATQSHVMADVSFQFSNLWFAGKQKNWALAQFFYNETRARVRWMIRIKPIVQDPDKKDVDLQGIFDAIDKDVWSLIKQAIDKKDVAQFETAYKLGLEKGCYPCHKSVGRPYLRPQVPTQMPQTIITFDPNAKWPE